jgi:hypothetical protein
VRDTQTDRQTSDLISLLSFLESRLKNCVPTKNNIPMQASKINIVLVADIE